MAAGHHEAEQVTVHDGLVGGGRRFGLAEVHRPLMDPGHHDGVAQGGVDLVPLAGRARHPAGLGVGRGHVLAAHEPGHALHLEHPADVLEEVVDEDHPAEVDAPGAEGRHLPVEHGDRRELVVHHVADARVAPADDGVALVGRPVGVEPVEGLLDHRVDRAVAHPVVVARAGWPRGGAAACRPARRARGSRRSTEATSMAWMPASTRTLASCRARCVGRVGLEQPAAHGVRHVVGGTRPVDAVHHEERGADGRRVELEPAHAGHRHVRCVLPHQLHHPELRSRSRSSGRPARRSVSGATRATSCVVDPLAVLGPRPRRRAASRSTCRWSPGR